MCRFFVKLLWFPHEDVTCIHWKHITHNLINILSNKKWNQYLLSHFHLTTIIQSLQSIRSMMHNSTQVQFTSKGSTSYISIIFTIYNQTKHLVLYMATCLEDVFYLLIDILFLDLNLKYRPYNQGLTFNLYPLWICL